MARTPKKNIYEKIEEQKNKIKETEELLVKLNDELKALNSEKDDLEMHQLFELMKSNGLTIDRATELLQSSNKKNK